MIPRTWWDTVFQPLKWWPKCQSQCGMQWLDRWIIKLEGSANIWLISKTHGDYFCLCLSFLYSSHFSTCSCSDGLPSHFCILHFSSYSYVVLQSHSCAGTTVKTLTSQLINTSTLLLVLVLLEFLLFYTSCSYAANGKTLLLEQASWEQLESL